MASPGYRWPPVPPPANRILTRVQRRDLSRRLRPRVHEHTRHEHGEHEIRSAVRYEGERQPGGGQQSHDDADVEIRGQDRREREPYRDELKEGRSRGARDAESKERVGGKREGETREPQEAPLLADVAGDEVAVRIGKKSVLLSAFAEAGAKPSARSNGDERLVELIA